MILTYIKQYILILLSIAAIGVSAENMQAIKNWRALPKGTSCTEDNGALKFETGSNAKVMHPYCRIPAGAFSSVRAIQFDIKSPSDAFASAILLYSKSQKKNIRFNFKVKAADVWQTVTVKLNNPAVNMAEVQGWQFSFVSREPGLTVWAKNIKCLDEAGKEVAIKSTAAKSASVKTVTVEVNQAVDLQSAKNWVALPKETSCTDEDGSLKFDTCNKAKTINPYCRIPAGAFSTVRALRFDIKIQANHLSSAILLYNKQQKKNIRFNFKVKSPEVWQTITVKLNNPAVNMAELTGWQFSFSGQQTDFSVWVKNLKCLDEAGREIVFQPKKKSNIKEWSLSPIGAPESFSALPGVPHDYLFSAKGLTEGQKIEWYIVDFSGKKTVCKGISGVKDQKYKVNAALPAGFYELCIDTTKQVFGISVLNARTNTTDLFFAIEALLYTTPDEPQESCLRFLAKHHIKTNRDMSPFHQLHPAPGDYRSRRDVLFQKMAKHQIQSIYSFDTFAAWQKPLTIGHKKRYLPQTLLCFDSALLAMYEKRKASAIMVQPLNEFDAREIPSECFMAPIRTATWAMRNQPEFLLGGAAFCKPATTHSVAQSIKNHMLDYIDVFAIHFYRPPEELLERTEGFRKAMLKHSQKGWMPIWITESGKPWLRGRSSKDQNVYNHSVINNRRPQVTEDTLSALWITANAIEAKTMGFERFFPFTMGFFQENNSNFGMMDYYRTPLRSLHCYCFAANLLAGKEYAGDPATVSGNMKMEHIFRGEKEAVVVFYAGMESHLKPYCEVDITRFPAGEGFSMAGEKLKSQNGVLRFQGGLAYWVFPVEKLTSSILNSATRNMTLLKGAKAYKKVPRVSTPLIIRYKFWQAKEPHYNQYAYFMESSSCVFQLTNLDDKALEFRPVITLPAGVSLRNKLPEKITIPPRSEKEFIVEIDPGKVKFFELRLKDANIPLSEIVVPLMAVANLRTVPVDGSRWKQNSAGRQTLTFDKEKNVLKVHTDFRNKFDPKSANWDFPELNLSMQEKNSNLIAVSFDIMIDPVCFDTNAQKWHMLQTGSWLDAAEHFPCTGVHDNWKSFTMYISGSKPRSFIRIGMATEAEELTYYLRNVKLHFEK